MAAKDDAEPGLGSALGGDDSPKTSAAKKPAGGKAPAAKAGTKKPIARTPSKKKQPEAPSARDYRPEGTFMPGDHDDEIPEHVAHAAAQLANPGGEPRTLTPGASDADATVARDKTGGQEDIDQRSYLARMFRLDTDAANDYGWAALVVALTALIALGAQVTTRFGAAIEAGVAALALSSALFAAILGVRGANLVRRGVATNGWANVVGIVVGIACVLTSLTVIVVRAVSS